VTRIRLLNTAGRLGQDVAGRICPDGQAGAYHASQAHHQSVRKLSCPLCSRVAPHCSFSAFMLSSCPSCRSEGFIVDPFWGSGGTPQPVQQFSAEIEQGGRERLRLALGLSVQHLMGDDVLEEELEEVGHGLFASAATTVALVVKNRCQNENLARDLANLGIPADCAGDIVHAAARAQERVDQLSAGPGPRFPSVADVRWRVDVTISTTALSRVLKPSVQLQLELSDGELERFEMTAEQLQDLRYDVARCAHTSQAPLHPTPGRGSSAAAMAETTCGHRALKEMQDLEESQAVRLAAGQPHPAARATPSKTAPTPTASPAAAPPRVIPTSAASAAATAAPAAAAAAAPPSDLPSF